MIRLKKCHIENFGKFNNFDFSFDSKLEIIVQDNGWGKTTFAAFIKAMLYGMPSSRSTNINENERIKYTPWSKESNFGGYLEFEVNNKSYRVERFFKKRSSEDTFKLIDLSTNKETEEYSENLGDELFDLNSSSFERSTYIPQKEIKDSSTDQINTKLVNIIQGTNDKDSFEHAKSLIEEKQKEIKLKNNRTDSKAKINQIDKEILALELSLEELTKEEALILDYKNKCINLEKSLEEENTKSNKIDSDIEKYTAMERYHNNIENFNKWSKDKKESEDKIKCYRRILNNNSIDEKDINSFESKNMELLNLKNTLFNLEDDKNSLSKKINKEDFLNSNKSQDQSALLKKTNKLNIILLSISSSIALSLIIAASILIIFYLIPAIVLFALSLLFIILIIILTIAIYFKKYIDSKTFNLDQIKETYNEQLKSEETLAQEITDTKEKISNIELDINNFLSKFNLDLNISYAENLKILKNTLNYLSFEEKTLHSIVENLSSLNIDESIGKDYKTNDFISISELQLKQKEIRNQITILETEKSNYQRTISSIEDKLENKNDIEEKLNQLLEEKIVLENEYKNLELTIKFLEEANNNLSSKYLSPLQQNLNKYLELIFESSNTNFTLNTDLNVMYEEHGKTYNLDFFSKGYQDILDICIRFALIDTIYKKEKPFIILDDPFVNMDKNKLNKVLNLIKEKSKETQIIYFTCHESRS